MMMVITAFVALAAPGFSKSCFDEGGSAADSNITFGGSVVSLLCNELQTCRKWFKNDRLVCTGCKIGGLSIWSPSCNFCSHSI